MTEWTTCSFMTYPGSRYGAIPEPPEYCENDAAEDSEFCPAHQADCE